MTAARWFTAYVDAVDFARLAMQCTTWTQAERYKTRVLAAYEQVKGAEYALEVQRQAVRLITGVDAMRNGVVP